MKSELAERLSPTSFAEHRDGKYRVGFALKKQLLQSVGIVYHRAVDHLEKAATLSLTKSRHKYSRIVDQSRIICEDYIYCRLQGLISRYPPTGDDDDMVDAEVDDAAEAAEFDASLNAVSNEIQHIGAKLELTYPSLYIDLPRHLAMPLRSQVAVRKALVCISDFMFRGQPPVITWCRIVGLFAVAAAIAREVVVNGNEHLIPTIVTTFGELVDCYLAPWIHKQGGWIQVVNEFRIDDSKSRKRVVTTIFGALVGFVLTWLLIPF